ncbi:hypothetical protein OOU_Y34scaffold00686g2 [Pyricularia oryzae Y34]|uniref:Uncharacterized protein n=2 Tax=Pyricularia oryzae TaxID=318829 RepID=A0AA97NT33_PYRO3|nr:hypothetical protein OOU_Y34scaffold00686g2 [Pyricularia oryzae Y34]
MAASSLEAKIGKEKCGVERSLQNKKRKIGMAGFNLELIEAVKEKTDNTVQKPVVDN